MNIWNIISWSKFWNCELMNMQLLKWKTNVPNIIKINMRDTIICGCTKRTWTYLNFLLLEFCFILRAICQSPPSLFLIGPAECGGNVSLTLIGPIISICGGKSWLWSLIDRTSWTAADEVPGKDAAETNGWKPLPPITRRTKFWWSCVTPISASDWLASRERISCDWIWGCDWFREDDKMATTGRVECPGNDSFLVAGGSVTGTAWTPGTPARLDNPTTNRLFSCKKKGRVLKSTIWYILYVSKQKRNPCFAKIFKKILNKTHIVKCVYVHFIHTRQHFYVTKYKDFEILSL